MRYLFILIFTLPLFASVITQELTRGSLSQSQTFNGNLSFNQKSELAAESSGLIKKIYFDETDFVKRGRYF